MWSEMLRAPVGAAVAVAVVVAAATVAHAADPPALLPAAERAGMTDQFPLGATGSGATDSPADPDQPPAVVPLPPAIGTGLAGLAGIAVFRVGRRVYRRTR